MPNYSASSIVNEFLKMRGSDSWPTQLTLQKLAYIAHGWNLAINGEPLIGEAPEAWDNGPVYRSVWDHIKKFGYRGPNCELVNPETKEIISQQLSQAELNVIAHVWRKYSNKTPKQLTDMTHEHGSPWYKSYFGRYKNASLNNHEIKQHYIGLAIAGRQQAPGHS